MRGALALSLDWTGRGIWKWTRRRNQKIHRLGELEPKEYCRLITRHSVQTATDDICGGLAECRPKS